MVGNRIEVLRQVVCGDLGDARIPRIALGSISEAEAGSLGIFVGALESLVEQWRQLLSTLGSPIHVGQLGAGAASKPVANLTLFGTLGVLGEALALAQGLGMSRNAAFDVLAATPLAPQAERRRGGIEMGDYPARFPLSLAHKDAGLIAEAATASGVDLKIGAAAAAWLADAEDAGWGDRDYSAVLARIIGTADMQGGSRDYRVRFYRVTELVTLLIEARDERALLGLKGRLGKLDLLVLDESGYVPASKVGAELLFDVISSAYERTSLIVTTNLPFESWTEVLGSERLTGATRIASPTAARSSRRSASPTAARSSRRRERAITCAMPKPGSRSRRPPRRRPTTMTPSPL